MRDGIEEIGEVNQLGKEVVGASLHKLGVVTLKQMFKALKMKNKEKHKIKEESLEVQLLMKRVVEEMEESNEKNAVRPEVEMWITQVLKK